MKHQLAAAFLCLAPVSALAEHGTQLAQWGSSSPKDEAPAAATTAPTDAPAAAPAAEVKATEKKTEEVQTISAVTTPEQLANIMKPSIQVSLDHNLGAGTFINASYYAQLIGAIDVAARYPFKVGPVKLGLSARGYLAYEYTMPDTVNGRRVGWRDLSFGLSAPAIFKESFTGISVSPGLSVLVPITPESWQAGVITVLGASLNFTRSLGRFDLALSLSGSRGFHRWKTSEIRPGGLNWFANEAAERGCVSRTGESSCGWSNTNNAWGVAGSASVDFHANDELTISASYALRTSWRYDLVPQVDPYTPKALNGEGESVATTGWAQGGNLVITSVAANYQFNDHWGVALYIATAMPPRTQDGKGFRFPFWAFDGAANNYSSIGLSISAGF